MLTTALICLAAIAAAALIVAAVLFVCGLLISAARSGSFDAHTATALAVLQPDHPDLPDDDELAAAVDALLADLFPTIRPAAPEES